MFLVCFFVLFYFIFGLFVSWFWFPFMSLIGFLVSLVSYFSFFLIAASGKEGSVLSSFCVVFFSFLFHVLSFPGGKVVCFNVLVGRVRDSCSAGQTMTYVFLHAYKSFVTGWEGLDVSKKSFIIAYPNIFFN